MTCPSDTVLLIDPAQSCQAQYQPQIGAVDQCLPVVINQLAGQSGGTYGPGTITHSYEAVDNYGNRDTCSFEVEVQRQTALVANFAWQANNLQYQFNDLSTGGPQGYAWDFGDNNTSTQPSPLHNYAMAGTYTVCLTVSDSCGYADTTCMMVSPMVGHEDELKNAIKIGPNPSDGLLRVTWKQGNTPEWALYDLCGKQLDPSVRVQPGEILLSGLNPGLFFLEVSLEGQSRTFRVWVR